MWKVCDIDQRLYGDYTRIVRAYTASIWFDVHIRFNVLLLSLLLLSTYVLCVVCKRENKAKKVLRPACVGQQQVPIPIPRYRSQRALNSS